MKKFTYPPELDGSCLIAYRNMLDRQICSADDILADPDLRREYVQRVREVLTAGEGRVLREVSEEHILRDLMRLRKAKKLPRSRPAKEADDA